MTRGIQQLAGLFSRVGLFAQDRANPILVRDIQQALRSRYFMIVLALSLSAILIVLLIYGQNLEYFSGSSLGRDFFLVILCLLNPVFTFVIPFNAFISMRHEMVGGASEQLLLSKLRPLRIVLGRLYSSLVQSLLFFAIFAPLMTISYFLRGISIAEIVSFFPMIVLALICTTAVAITAGTLCRYSAAGPFIFGLIGIGLASGTIGCWAFLDESWIWRSWSFSVEYLITIIIFSVVIIISLLISASLLTHPFENRSTTLRLIGFIVIPLLFLTFVALWIGTFSGGDSARLSACLILATLPFTLFAVTEEKFLSPAHRVPRWLPFALVAAPFLPGRGRGLVYSLLLTACLTGLAYGYPVKWYSGTMSDKDAMIVGFFILESLVFFCGAYLLRSALRRGSRWNWITRLTWFMFFGFLQLVGNIFISDYSENEMAQIHWVGSAIFAPLLLLLSLAGCWGGVREVLVRRREGR